ncbi:MAG: iron-regulated protein [Phyllobacteriaceae bacterium]|nr:iron-regulated protein [Phyllobacteriaceae bacterium]
MKNKLWLGVGTFVLAGAISAPANPASPYGSAAPKAPHAPLHLVAEAGEGGEGGGGAPSTYALGSTDPGAFHYDASTEIAAYVDLVRASYGAAAGAADKLVSAVDAFLSDPTEERLAGARKAWIAARPTYLVTEAFRFYDGPIENIEGRLNAWPMNEAYVDYVVGDPAAGLVNGEGPISLDAINAADQRDDEADVTTGWHAIEFLLWGQDLSDAGPGARPASDYAPGTKANDRRREYLDLVARQLATDLFSLAGDWTAEGKYPKWFLALPQREAIGRMINGMAILAGYEFMSERLAVALDSGDQEDEHSCFSDTTKQDFIYDLAGIKAVWTGEGAGEKRPGLSALMRRVDGAEAAKIDGLFAQAETRIAALGDPWDRVLAASPGSPERQAAEAAVAALQALGEGLRSAGAKLGVLVLIPEAG